ncbi:DUF58 domain-containing protein [Litchfieldia alkalitelluris]|uniref:DUF58 domain-containing protein n=1 Tax=Litchfieldia alkalitelluris TaxID=304268 RepID=UPI000998E560|nr:DUF58 domain-containing protein [Litchfieldia alkalitelluris]
MLKAIKQWMPRDQRGLLWGVMFVWLTSLLFLLFTGGELGVLLFFITTVITTYLLLLGKWSGIKDIKGERASTNPGQRLETGDSFHVETSFEIPGFWPISYVLIKDEITHHQFGKQIYQSSFVPTTYRTGKVSYTISNLKRGAYDFGATECSITDLLNLFQHKATILLPVTFKVYPKSIRIKEWSFVSALRSGVRDSSMSRNQKETTEIDGVREYTNGDRLSRIHWNASAKTGELKSKEFIRESVPKILIVIDQYHHSYHDEEQFELAVSTAASIIRYSSKQQIPIGLFSPGKKVNYYEVQQGMTYSHRLEEHLLYVKRDGENNIPKALLHRHLTRLQGSLIVVITPEKSNLLFHRLVGMKKMNLHPCHICIAPQKDSEVEKWKRRLDTEQIHCYMVDSLKELPVVLGGKTVEKNRLS